MLTNDIVILLGYFHRAPKIILGSLKLLALPVLSLQNAAGGQREAAAGVGEVGEGVGVLVGAFKDAEVEGLVIKILYSCTLAHFGFEKQFLFVLN